MINDNMLMTGLITRFVLYPSKFNKHHRTENTYYILLVEDMKYLNVLDITSVGRLMPLIHLSRLTMFHMIFNSQTLYLFYHTPLNNFQSIPLSNI